MKALPNEIPKFLTLRRGLKALFHYQDIDSEINSLIAEDIEKNGNDRLSDKLQTLLRICPDGYTIDQNYSCASEFCQKYTKGVFDAIFCFAKECCLFEGLKIVCRYESLLRWHEMSSLLSEDLLVCSFLATNDEVCSNFSWTPNIRTNNNELNNLLSKELADVHAHLIGSSLNFDVNWICLMNYIDGRERLFEEIEHNLQNKQLSLSHKYIYRSFYTLAIIAAAIRVRLFGNLCGVEPISNRYLKELLKLSGVISNKLYTSNIVGYICRDIEAFRTYSASYSDSINGEKVQYDYAHIKSLEIPENEACAYSTLSGERFILYSVLHKIYKDELPDFDKQLFYIYLLIKHKIRHELIQTNDETGFGNFNLYDKRKRLFIDDEDGRYKEYLGLLKHLSVASFFAGNECGRWHETRITPCNKIDHYIINTDKDINNPKLKKSQDKWKYGYIFHFIKSRDLTDKQLYDIRYRHYKLRKKVKNYALDIVKSKLKENRMYKDSLISDIKILGIDAASSEINSRPEVFAQAYRYCRHFVPEIGITFHVGEDFHDIVDGLRAVDECIKFLDMHPYDRLGHTLVLGLNVDDYYLKRRNVITMPKQVALDNIVWLYMLCYKHNKLKRKLRDNLLELYNILFSELYSIYGDIPCISTYYNSWLLRGDSPYLYNQNGITLCNNDVEEGWNNVSMSYFEDSRTARNDIEACRLYYYYHRDAEAKIKGEEMISVEFGPDLIKAIKYAQKYLLNKLESLKLCIECNPTSNFKIGDIERYDEHPIRIFHSNGLNGCFKGKRISVSINTDDKGVFATSIEREYALIATALFRKYGGSKKTEEKVLKWLDCIRECSLKQKFIGRN